MDDNDINSLSELVVMHNAVIRSAGILAALSGLSTRLPIEPFNEVLSFTLLSMAILLWLELRSKLVHIISLDRRFLARMLTATAQYVRLVWFIMMIDVAALVFAVIWLFAYPEVTGRLILIEVFILTVPLVVSRIMKRGTQFWRSVRHNHDQVGKSPQLIFGSGYLIVSLPILVIACIYIPNLIEFIRDGLGLPQ